MTIAEAERLIEEAELMSLDVYLGRRRDVIEAAHTLHQAKRNAADEQETPAVVGEEIEEV